MFVQYFKEKCCGCVLGRWVGVKAVLGIATALKSEMNGKC
jgi:hypothetical protein